MRTQYAVVVDGDWALRDDVDGLAARTITYLETIDKVVANLAVDKSVFEVFATGFEVLDLAVQKHPDAVRQLDGMHVCETFHTLIEALESRRDIWSARLQNARQDRRLREEDGVVEAFEQALVAIERTIGAAKELVERIEILEALAEPESDESFDDVEKLIAALKG